ncbi:hypothetical protein [Paenibacillus pini]|uniref:Portal protein n=1 Tax=Paenibacillus pini JCM 16418 TaxID=1236976 RepID=W7YQL3_9BACL|nr:hypothetical protein [Paenibacillus pini]GAF10847.1 hypothetical protein JCM16418_5072 [Paenibacillus pini JCM 16418]
MSDKIVGSEDFKVIIASKADADTLLFTAKEQGEQWLEQAMFNFNNNYHQYSTYLNESSFNNDVINNNDIDILAQNTQSDLQKILKVNSIARYYINKDDLIGKIFETIESNINTDFKTSYKDFSGNKSKQKILEKTKEIINDFNKQINLKSLLRKSIPVAYCEGNYPLYLRRNKAGNYIVDSFPLGVVEVSDYEIDGEPCLLININELKSRLQKTKKKTRDGKSLFFDNIEQELINNYPSEVFEAYKNKDTYAKLDIKYSGILRVNNLNRKYGLTPVFRTLKSAIMLETFEKTDRTNAKAKGKKVIFQKLRSEILGIDGDKQGFEQMAYAHESFMGAWKNDTVIYTGAAFVEDIKYIEPTTDNININNVNYYRSKIMTALGIGFLNQDAKQTVAVANISISELMKTINKITEQLEDILEKWYKIILQLNHIPIEYCPTIRVIDSELLSSDMRLQLLETLFSKMNLSYETTLGLFDISVEDEKQKRIKENEQHYDKIFSPRTNAFTNSGKTDNNKPLPTVNNEPNKTTIGLVQEE